MLHIRTALLTAAILGAAATATFAANPPAPTPLFNEKKEFDHGVSLSGHIAGDLNVTLVCDYEATNRSVPGLGNLDGLPLPVMRPKTKQQVLRLTPNSAGMYEAGFRTLLRTKLGGHYMLRHVRVQVDSGSQSRDRALFGTHVFFGETGVPCESLKRVVVTGEDEKHMRLRLDGEQNDLPKYTFGLIPPAAGDTRVSLDFSR